jgi:4-amino-4-deoxy-L-arabinose transferase-like glycosyltransferase
MQKYRFLVGILIIVALALSLRLWGIEWGLPNTLHASSYHTDEAVVLLHSRPGIQGLNLFAGQFLPHYYNYGSLQLYLNNIAISIVSAYMPPAHGGYGSPAQLDINYLTGRLLTVFMGTATVWALWAFGRRVYGEWAALLGAFLLAVAPLHAQHSHFMTVDVPATLWVVLSLLWCAKAQLDEQRLRALAIAGCFAGLATATKYNCVLVMLPVLYAGLAATKSGTKLPVSKKIIGILCACLAMSAAYFVACPGTILESGTFIQDFRFEAVHVSSQQELWFQGSGVGWWYIVARNLGDGLGLPLLLASIVGLAYAVRKRTYGDLLALSFAIPYYLLVGAAVSRYARYEIPLVPILALFAGRLLADAASVKSVKPAWSARGVSAIVAAAATVSTVFLLVPMTREDPRDRAAEWIEANAAAPSTQIGMPVTPWFWSPPIDPYFCLPGPVEWQNPRLLNNETARIVPDYTSKPTPAPFDSSVLLEQKPAIVVMSEFEYFDRLRLKDPATLAYVAELRKDYSHPIVFSDPHWLGGRKTIDSLPCQDLPHDMLYTSPTVLIFRRN